MGMRYRVAVGVLLLVLLAMVGCEGNDEPTLPQATTTTTSLTTTTALPTTTTTLAPTTTTAARRVTPTTRATPDGGPVYYSNCSEARAAGAAPLYRGQPGYGSHLDREGDGVACE